MPGQKDCVQGRSIAQAGFMKAKAEPKIAPRILLIIGGGIAAYKSCELVRLIRKGANGIPGEVTCVLTDGGAKFVTAMTLAALSENPVHTTLWDLKNEVEMGHIQLSRQADLIVVCPATADLMAKMAGGIADDLATTLLLATDKPVLAVPAMNVRMWEHPATRRNVAALIDHGVAVLDPDDGAMACGEFGPGRLPEPAAIWIAICQLLGLDPGPVAVPLLAAPDEDYSQSEDTGIAGLSGMIIPRSTVSKRVFDELDEDDLAFRDEPVSYHDLIEPVPGSSLSADPAPSIDLNSPLLSKKGKAKAAPPTDPDAVNHLFNGTGEEGAPQPMPEDGAVPPPDSPPAKSSSKSPPADPLEGQPDFAGDDPAPYVPVDGPLTGKHVLVTAGPTHEPIDPVRYIANRSSGKQGFAIAAAAAQAGARVTLVSGPVTLPTPPGVDRIDVETAREMAAAAKKALPADVAVMVAAVADWRTHDFATEKLKKRGSAPPSLRLTENPDILGTMAGDTRRPALLIGFAAETEKVIEHAKEKRTRKGADWIVANDVSGPKGKSVMGSAANTVHIITAGGVETLPKMLKSDVADALIERIVDELGK